MQQFFYKLILLFSFRGQKMREPRPDWSPLGVNFKILDEHPLPPETGSLDDMYVYVVVQIFPWFKLFQSSLISIFLRFIL